ncbi:solute carrier family 45 member 3 [Passer montanus]|uniref:solute carrier family 45 member 3 n=1 Tax=Passer montanus TaxID=9160 RepID=UPI0019616B8D|nr:solute carrier family 45 member 3 [Passer montanus]XP_039558528.1 solute carrier family 45 member 3 [Passer montanus]XP_039558529.1 solute carrier family 45 member 3 [Passer montanus]XP_039558530.1 solute carrier family 45 member 3 [Passer montanus]
MSFQSRRTQLLLVNSLTFGLEVCLAAGITYVPPLLLEVGVEEKFMTMVLGIGPVLGLVFVPLIGSASDHWHSSYGRRRPFIWLLCLGVLLSLFVIPHASSLASLCALNPRPLEIAFLIVGIGLLDFCGQVCFTPLEALLSDLFQEPDSCRQAFSMYAFMVSLGGCIGYLLPAIDWAFLAPYLGGQQSCLFTLLALIFLGCVLATLFVTEEAAQGDVPAGPAPKDASPGVSVCCWRRGPCVAQGRRALQAAGKLCLLLDPRLHGLCCRVPSAIRRLFVAELCSWMALMTFMLFYTDFVGEGLYHGVPRAKPGTEARRHYDEGVRMGSLGLFLQCITSIFFSTIMDRLVKHFGTRAVYLASVVFFPGAAFVMCLSHSVTVVTISAALTGFTFSALQILPYTLASLYHHDKQVFLHKFKRKEEEDAALLDKKPAFSKGLLSSQKLSYQNGHAGSLFSSSSSSSPSSSSPAAVSSSALCGSSPCDVSLRIVVGEPELGAPARGICLDLAILDSAFLLSQVVPSLFMGSIVQFTQSVTAYMVSAAGLGLVAIYFATKVVFDKGDVAKCSV